MTKSNKILPLLIITVYFLQFAVPASIFIHFKIYQDEIEAAFCINIDKPEMNCHGQCHMQKQIAKVTNNTDSEKKKSNRTLQIEELIGIQNDITVAILKPIVLKEAGDHFYPNNLYQSTHLRIEVPPPQI